MIDHDILLLLLYHCHYYYYYYCSSYCYYYYYMYIISITQRSLYHQKSSFTHSEPVSCKERDAEGQLRHFDAVAGAVAVGCSALNWNPMDNDGKICGKRWKICGKRWKTMENYGKLLDVSGW